MPSFGKIVRAVSENEPERTDGGDSIGPFGFQPGTNKNDFLYFVTYNKYRNIIQQGESFLRRNEIVWGLTLRAPQWAPGLQVF